ncbi:hypothetical protein N781_11625 [Pontibacillus halophilus JSM 076056 = DSM 19796]|uniref:Uncharacterized protein n=1 Tax=Pontibacillus halophilus JSM 076056 = DSM 19796 TaxID=1385510 RepID=A0A0A5G6L7_9BACI|nr:hypothetical protein N781_11625 [Pontibacillus halophilus JSM 076056 = DSM 19796]
MRSRRARPSPEEAHQLPTGKRVVPRPFFYIKSTSLRMSYQPLDGVKAKLTLSGPLNIARRGGGLRDSSRSKSLGEIPQGTPFTRGSSPAPHRKASGFPILLLLYKVNKFTDVISIPRWSEGKTNLFWSTQYRKKGRGTARLQWEQELR